MVAISHASRLAASAEPPSADPAALGRVFVIHCEDDEWFVRGQLLPALGLPDEAVRLSSSLPLGELTLEALDREISECRVTLVVASHAAAAAPWARFAAGLVSHAAVEGQARVIPLLLDAGAGERWLRLRVSIDLTDPARRGGELAALTARLGLPAAARPTRIECPYPGMRALGPQDGALLFGRDGDVAKIVAALLAGQRELVLVGASGSGKSSLVHAGVVPRLAKGRWRDVAVRELRPGAHPMQRLEAALACPGGGAWEARAAALLEADGAEGHLVLVIDQLEEVFALAEPAERAAFFAALIALRAHPRCYLLSCLRADFFGRLIESALWRGRDVTHLVIEPLAGAPLRRAIVSPAREAGVFFEPPLVERLLQEAAASEHSLPLLQAALVQLWEEREGSVLSLATYQRVCGGHESGLGAAMARHADACLGELTAAQRKVARRVLLRLVSFGQSAEDTRWARPRAELVVEGEPEAELEEVLEHLTRARLLVRDAGGGDAQPSAERVDLAHEALLSSWPRLAEWIGERRADGHRLRQHERAAAVWAARGGGGAGLLDGRELAESRRWRQSEPARELGERAELTAFFAASERAHRGRTRRGGATALVLVGLLAAALVGLFAARSATSRRHAAERGRAVAVAERHRSELRRVKALARAELAQEHPQRARSLLEKARQLSSAGGAPAAPDAVPDAVPDVGPDAAPDVGPDVALALMAREAQRAPLVARQAHASEISAIAMSPDGAQYASATVGGELRLWRTADGSALSPPLRHARGALTGVAYFPDGRLVSAGEDGTARVWDAEGRATGPVFEHGAPVRVVKVSPDGHAVLTGGDDGRAVLWSAGTGAPVAVLVHRAAVRAAAFSRDSSLVATASDDHGARVWRTSDGKPVSRVLPHEDNLSSLDLSPDNARLLTANADKGAKVWQLRTGATAFDIPVPRGLSRAEYSPDGAQILTAADNKWAGRWAARDGAAQGGSLLHRGGVNEARYSGDGSRIVTASNDKTARVWDRTTGRSLTSPLQHEGKVSLVAVNREGTIVVTAAEDRHTYLWKVQVPAAELVTFPHEGAVQELAFSRDGTWLATASADKHLRLWDAATGELRLLLPHFGAVFHVAVSPDRQRIATATGSTVRLWTPDGDLVREFAHADYVKGLAFDRRSSALFSASADGEVRGTDLRGGALIFREALAAQVTCLALSEDGARLAVGTEAGAIRLWDVPSHRELPAPQGHIERVTSLQFSADGARLLSASEDRKAQVWRVGEQKALVTLPHEQPVRAARFSPDERWIATASRRAVVLWRADGEEELLRRAFADWILSVEWSPDGRWLAIGGRQNLVERWALEAMASPLGAEGKRADLSAQRTLPTLALPALPRSAPR